VSRLSIDSVAIETTVAAGPSSLAPSTCPG
jgi:hypothetical protein